MTPIHCLSLLTIQLFIDSQAGTEIDDAMQATLVSHYGPKSEKLASHLKCIQDELTAVLSPAFTPYVMEQIHATIIGLEGRRRNGQIKNANFHHLRQESRYVDPYQLLSFLRSPAVPSFDVQIAGYVKSSNYEFLSQYKHPYLRSFSIQGNIAVAMGWPSDRSSVIDEFRHTFNQINALHKWHKTDSDIDNDFFFVLGRVNRESISDAAIAKTEEKIRQMMANSDPITVNVDHSTLSIVCYSDTQLPLSTSHVHTIDDHTFTADEFLQCYEN